MKTACIVLGSGSGNRFSKHQSKLFYKLNNHLLIEYTLKNITKHVRNTYVRNLNKRTVSNN